MVRTGAAPREPPPPGRGRRRRISAPGGAGSTRYLDPAHPPQGPWSTRYAGAVARRKWLVLAGWVLATALLSAFAPSLGAGGDQLGSIIPLDSPAIRAEVRSIAAFGFPLSSRTVVVQRDPTGCPRSRRRRPSWRPCR